MYSHYDRSIICKLQKKPRCINPYKIELASCCILLTLIYLFTNKNDLLQHNSLYFKKHVRRAHLRSKVRNKSLRDTKTNTRHIIVERCSFMCHSIELRHGRMMFSTWTPQCMGVVGNVIHLDNQLLMNLVVGLGLYFGYVVRSQWL